MVSRAFEIILLSQAMTSALLLTPRFAPGVQISARTRVSMAKSETGVRLPEGWTELLAPNGSPYYLNSLTGEAVWEPPEGVPVEAETGAQQPAEQTPDAPTEAIEYDVPDEPMVPMVFAIPEEPMVLAIPDEPTVVSAAGWDEVWLDLEASQTRTLGESIQHGDVVVRVPEMASEGDLQKLLAAGLAAGDAQRARSGDPTNGRNRFPVCDSEVFSQDVVLCCEEILLRVLDFVDDNIPSVYETLFRPSDAWASRQPLTAQGTQPEVPPPSYLADSCPSLRELYMAGELEWSEGEPAINVYTANGRFGPHADHMGLTVLIPLTCPTTDFSGGGTGFWGGRSSASGGKGLDGLVNDVEHKGGMVPEGPPTTVLKPPLGTALLFGGDLTHAGMPVETGVRSVFVMSFSTRTPVSREDRVHGLQPAPSSSWSDGFSRS